MDHPAYAKLMEYAATPEALSDSVDYLAEHLDFLKPNDAVLICFTRNQPYEIGSLFEKAVRARGAVPVFWEKDYRWKTLIRQAFQNNVSTVIGPPLVVLGLGKIARYKATPLRVRNIILAGYPSLEWMLEGIIECFDCHVSGCFTPGSRLVCGYSCDKIRGIHLRDDKYGLEVVDDQGNLCADGEIGDMILFDKQDPSVRYPCGERCRIQREPCACGATSIHLLDMRPGTSSDLQLDSIVQELISWTSVLDCRLRKGEQGLNLELIVFPGEKLPKLPSTARQVVRAWDPEKDEPFYYVPGIEKTGN